MKLLMSEVVPGHIVRIPGKNNWHIVTNSTRINTAICLEVQTLPQLTNNLLIGYHAHDIDIRESRPGEGIA